MSKLAVVGHFFYREQAEVILSLLQAIPLPLDLYISVSAQHHDEVLRVLKARLPGRKIMLRSVENRGYDIVPFVCTFRDIYPAYNLILKIHTKKSAHTFCLKTWADYLLKNLTGSPEVASAILKMFEEDPKLGLVYPAMIPLFKQELIKDPWQGNWELCQKLGARLGLSVQKEVPPEFPAGSMFWFRPKALEPLFELGLSPEDFPEGKRFHRNGTLAHAIERLFVLIVRQQGFGAREVCFQPFKGVRDGSLWGRFQNAACCEWERLMHGIGLNR